MHRHIGHSAAATMDETRCAIVMNPPPPSTSASARRPQGSGQLAYTPLGPLLLRLQQELGAAGQVLASSLVSCFQV